MEASVGLQKPSAKICRSYRPVVGVDTWEQFARLGQHCRSEPILRRRLPRIDALPRLAVMADAHSKASVSPEIVASAFHPLRTLGALVLPDSSPRLVARTFREDREAIKQVLRRNVLFGGRRRKFTWLNGIGHLTCDLRLLY